MLLSALSRNKIYAKLVSEHILKPNFNVKKSAGSLMPSISKLQEMIEWAWEEGFDAQGREQLGGKLCGTRKWIGATEVTTLLSSMRIKFVFYLVYLFYEKDLIQYYFSILFSTLFHICRLLSVLSIYSSFFLISVYIR